MNRFWLSLGSNIDPEKNLRAGLKALQSAFRLLKVSSLYETEPVGPAGPHKFWNAAVLLETDLTGNAVLKELRKIEASLGRRRSPDNKYAPRTLDIDILPQKDYENQAFIMIPLAEIAPDEKDPHTGMTFGARARLLAGEAAGFKKFSA